VYKDFKNALSSKGLAYSGMICRDVVENISANIKVYDKAHYVFVGFNVLSPSEEALLEALKDKSLFYWDCDDYYTDNRVIEAGQFIRKNIQKFIINNKNTRKKYPIFALTKKAKMNINT